MKTALKVRGLGDLRSGPGGEDSTLELRWDPVTFVTCASHVCTLSIRSSWVLRIREILSEFRITTRACTRGVLGFRVEGFSSSPEV